MSKLKVQIVTPESTAFTGEADMVVLPGVDGEFGILPQHIPLIAKIAPGELRLVNGGREEFLAVGSGFVEVTGFEVSVLTDMAVGESDIDEEAVTKALHRAEAAMAEKLGEEDQAAMEAVVAKSLAQLNLKRRRHG